jgi:hypothetical protein
MSSSPEGTPEAGRAIARPRVMFFVRRAIRLGSLDSSVSTVFVVLPML